MAGAATLAIMVLPVIMRTTEEALLCVPDSFREGSFGLGAGKLRTIFKIVLPSAIPGILSGIILAIGRIVGETAALIYTSGTVANLAGFFDSGRTLAIHMYSLSREGMHTNEAYATAVVLLIVVLIINGVSSLIAKKFEAAETVEWRKKMAEKFKISNLDLYYGDFHALKNINMSIASNEITAFIGPSGCGKPPF